MPSWCGNASDLCDGNVVLGEIQERSNGVSKLDAERCLFRLKEGKLSKYSLIYFLPFNKVINREIDVEVANYFILQNAD